jgi:hypothetical protein
VNNQYAKLRFCHGNQNQQQQKGAAPDWKREYHLFITSIFFCHFFQIIDACGASDKKQITFQQDRVACNQPTSVMRIVEVIIDVSRFGSKDEVADMARR